MVVVVVVLVISLPIPVKLPLYLKLGLFGAGPAAPDWQSEQASVNRDELVCVIVPHPEVTHITQCQAFNFSSSAVFDISFVTSCDDEWLLTARCHFLPYVRCE